MRPALVPYRRLGPDTSLPLREVGVGPALVPHRRLGPLEGVFRGQQARILYPRSSEDPGGDQGRADRVALL